MSHTTQEEIEFASDPDRWPVWPQLPLFHKDGRAGRLVSTWLEDDTVKPTVYLGLIFEPIDPKEKVEYSDLSAVFDDGWRID